MLESEGGTAKAGRREEELKGGNADVRLQCSYNTMTKPFPIRAIRAIRGF